LPLARELLIGCRADDRSTPARSPEPATGRGAGRFSLPSRCANAKHPRMPRLLLLPLLVLSTALAAAPAATVRVLCYNIHHGEGIDQKLDLERIAKVITDARADIVALQEVDRGCTRTQKRDLPAELAQLTGLTAYFEKNLDYQGGEYGNAVLTRFPIKRAKNTHYKMLRPGEQRGVLQLVLDVHGREVLFMNTHIDHRPDDSERLINADELRDIVAAAGRMPVILCGDFNTVPGSRTHEKLKAFLTDSWEVVGKGPGFTIPVLKPAKRIDYVFISRETVEPLKMEVIHSIASDHLPVFAELRLK
jgi:endonuclease/exonuclease/phosphatase family metal-dependent hydrolase